MLGYKRKLVDMPGKDIPHDTVPPHTVEAPAAPKAVSETSSRAHEELTQEKIDALRESLRRELEIDLEKLRAEKSISRDGLAAVTTGDGVKWIIFSCVLGLMALLTAAGFWWTNYRRIPQVNHQLEKMQTDLSLELKQFFDRPEFKAYLEKRAKEYTDQNLKDFWESRVGETLAPYVKETQSLVNRIRYETDTSVKKLNSVSEFMLLESRAQNDERAAYEELLKISRDRNHPFRELAKQATTRIFAELSALGETKTVPDYPLKDKFKGLAYDDFKKAYRESIPLYRSFILEDFWADPLYTAFQKLGFLAEVIRGEDSLRALQKACQIMDREAMLFKPFTAYEVYLDWWNTHQKKYNTASPKV